VYLSYVRNVRVSKTRRCDARSHGHTAAAGTSRTRTTKTTNAVIVVEHLYPRHVARSPRATGFIASDDGKILERAKTKCTTNVAIKLFYNPIVLASVTAQNG
jgi:hypothetical protein